VAIASLGLWLAYRLFLKNPKLHTKVAEAWPRLYRVLTHKYYVDEIYEALFVNRLKDLSVSLGFLDAKLIDGVAVDGAAALTRFFSRVSMWWDKWIVDGLVNLLAKVSNGFSVPVRMLQTGMFSTYAAMILLGLVILLGYYGHHMQIWVRNLR
jgi:NADH-quinone oxidoreductase subunit L